MQPELTIKLLNGGERFGLLNREFNPTSGHIDFFCTAEQRSESLDLKEICYIKFLGKPDLADSFSEDEFFEDVTTSLRRAISSASEKKRQTCSRGLLRLSCRD